MLSLNGDSVLISGLPKVGVCTLCYLLLGSAYSMADYQLSHVVNFPLYRNIKSIEYHIHAKHTPTHPLKNIHISPQFSKCKIIIYIYSSRIISLMYHIQLLITTKHLLVTMNLLASFTTNQQFYSVSVFCLFRIRINICSRSTEIDYNADFYSIEIFRFVFFVLFK